MLLSSALLVVTGDSQALFWSSPHVFYFKKNLFCPPAIPRALRSTRTRSRTNTTVSSFQTTDTVLQMLPALAGATAAKVLVCFLYYAIC